MFQSSFDDVAMPQTPVLMLSPEDVEFAAQYVDYGAVRDKMLAFLNRADVVDYLENRDEQY